ncbi:hypothetical protein SBC1_12420 [Caballeronia sp. SBC1]|nr:hypothetical protein SBC2_13830 [Caballeronia sp. SBC2]QIN61256.1 hypothetical protein SBC1_12420 [Caballeronia sp. SBC1]
MSDVTEVGLLRCLQGTFEAACQGKLRTGNSERRAQASRTRQVFLELAVCHQLVEAARANVERIHAVELAQGIG